MLGTLWVSFIWKVILKSGKFFIIISSISCCSPFAFSSLLVFLWFKDYSFLLLLSIILYILFHFFFSFSICHFILGDGQYFVFNISDTILHILLLCSTVVFLLFTSISFVWNVIPELIYIKSRLKCFSNGCLISMTNK